MAITECPECKRPVSDRALSCPGCGYPLNQGSGPLRGFGYPYFYGYEYKSKATVLGMPLVHIAQGFTPEGRLRVARGFIAIGGLALGVFSLAGIGLGIVCLAGVALSLLAGLGGVAVGYIAVGGWPSASIPWEGSLWAPTQSTMTRPCRTF
jgi:hypothetical protein